LGWGRSRSGSGIALTGLVLLLAFSARGQEKAPTVEKKPVIAEKAAPSATAYAGMETCAGCHEEIAKPFGKNPHAVLETTESLGWKGRACEACHGPGAKHADSLDAADILNPGKAAPERANAVCLSCHRNQTVQTNHIQSSHAKNEVACVACHSVHKGPEALLPRKFATVNGICTSCHSATLAAFHKPYAHRLPQNAMSCVDCHDPHGTPLAKPVSNVFGNDTACLKCHGDLRGPFVFDHAPMRVEGCSSCHAPHGSANPKMLTRREVRFVCLECHSNMPVLAASGPHLLGTVPPAFHDLRSPQYQNCTICHVKIHGSNVNRSLLR